MCEQVKKGGKLDIPSNVVVFVYRLIFGTFFFLPQSLFLLVCGQVKKGGKLDTPSNAVVFVYR